MVTEAPGREAEAGPRPRCEGQQTPSLGTPRGCSSRCLLRWPGRPPPPGTPVPGVTRTVRGSGTSVALASQRRAAALGTPGGRLPRRN